MSTGRLIGHSLGLLLALAPAQAAEPLPTETAKLFTQDAVTVEDGRTEVEFHYLIGQGNETFGPDGELLPIGRLRGHVFALQATHGMEPRLDGTLVLLWRDLLEDQEGLLSGDVVNLIAHVKWRFHQSKSKNLMLAWMPGVTAPIADTSDPEQVGPGQVYWTLDNLIVLTYLAGRFNLSFDFGYAQAIGPARDGQIGETVGNLAFGYQVSPSFQPIFEINFAHAFVDGPEDSSSTWLLIGAVFNISDTFRIDAGVQHTVRGMSTSKGTGLIVNFSKTF